MTRWPNFESSASRRRRSIPRPSADERRRIARGLKEGTLRLLYVAPERLLRDDTIAYLKGFSIDLPRHRRGPLRVAMGARLPPRISAPARGGRRRWARLQTIAVTATADAPTRDDIAGSCSSGAQTSSCARSTGRTCSWRCGRRPTRRASSSSGSTDIAARAASSIAPRAGAPRNSPTNSPHEDAARCPITPGSNMSSARPTRTPSCKRTVSSSARPSPSAWASTSRTCGSSFTPTCRRRSKPTIRRSAAPGATDCPPTRSRSTAPATSSCAAARSSKATRRTSASASR